MLNNRYFEFTESVLWFKEVGSSPSNVWYGASRLIDTVYEPSRTEPGDTLHVLVGGTFLVRAGGSVESGRLRLRKPHFEKEYGLPLTDERIGEMMVACGRCREVPGPTSRIDYNAARVAASENRLPELMGPILKGDFAHSPLLQDLFAACYSADLGSAVGAAGGKWRYSDVGRGSEPDSLECTIRVDLGNGKHVSVSASPTRRDVWVRDDTKLFAPALRDGGAERYELEPEYRNELVTIVHEDQTYAVVEAIADFVRGELVPESARAVAPG